MNLCSYGHQEVCWDFGRCPVCELELEKDAQIENLEQEIEELRGQLKEANEVIAEERGIKLTE